MKKVACSGEEDIYGYNVYHRSFNNLCSENEFNPQAVGSGTSSNLRVSKFLPWFLSRDFGTEKAG